MVSSLVPGIRRLPQAQAHPQLGLVRTDIAAFVGMTERGPLRDAVRLTSWEEYRRIFGGFQTYGFVPYSVRGFFENGGTECFVVRVTRQDGPAGTEARAARFMIPGGYRVKGQFSLTGPVDLNTRVAPASGALPPAGSIVRFDSTAELAVIEAVAAGSVTFVAQPSESYDAGTVLTWLEGTTLAADVAVDGTSVQVAADIPVSARDLLAISGDGESAWSIVRGKTGPALALEIPLQKSFKKGAIVLVTRQALWVEAASAGSWGNRLRVQITPVDKDRADIRTTLGPGPEGGAQVREVLRRVLWNDQLPAFVEANSSLIRVGLPDSLPPDPVEYSLVGGTDGVDGLSLQDYLGNEGEPDATQWYGIKRLETEESIAIVCAPDAVYLQPELKPPPAPEQDPCSDPEPVPLPPAPPPKVNYTPEQVYQGLLLHCDRMRYRVAVLDTPALQSPATLPTWVTKVTSPGSRLAKWGALYYPWLKVPNVLANARTSTVVVPTAGHVAGLYAANDLELGVHHPPANREMRFVSNLEREVADEAHANLNASGINVIRLFPGRGIRVWGARSLAAIPGDNWQFIHARRLMSYIERSVELAMQWTVFEPNDFSLRRTLVHQLTEFLSGIWRKGGLKGARPEEGLYVKCDSSNNPQSVLDAGQLVCEVGVAIPAPMEFMVFEIRLGTGSVQVKET